MNEQNFPGLAPVLPKFPALPLTPSAALSGVEPFLSAAFGSAHERVSHGMVFVIMPFVGEGTDEIYSVVKDECQKLRLHAKRVDENVGSDFVIKEIGALIAQAEFIICDLTHERPNVYYELGYAHGVGNNGSNILLTAQEGTRLHFDIGPLRVQYYPSAEKLRVLLARNLTEMIRKTRNAAVASVVKSPNCDADPAQQAASLHLSIQQSE